jgi:hypothetical protein
MKRNLELESHVEEESLTSEAKEELSKPNKNIDFELVTTLINLSSSSLTQNKCSSVASLFFGLWGVEVRFLRRNGLFSSARPIN